MRDDERDQLLSQLSAHRAGFLRIAERVDDAALAALTRNPEWSVRAVLAHVLASDADLISVLERANDLKRAPLTEEEHRDEMSRWKDTTPADLRAALSERTDQWKRLIEALPPSCLDAQVDTWWASGSLVDVIGDYVAHDPEHAEDVRLALEGLRG